MKFKIGIYIIFLILIFFIPLKTADYIINKDTKDTEEEKEWTEQTNINTTDMEEVPKEDKNNNNSGTDSTQDTSNWWEYPDTIYETTRSGDDLLVLVNKQYKLPSTYAPKDLVLASNAGIRRGESYYLRNIIIADLKSIVDAAKADGIDLSIVSAYRSYQTQVDTYNYWLNKNNNDVAYVDTFSARPGHSQHQLGTTIDFSTNEIGDSLGDTFANTKASKWLSTNSYLYGFVLSFPKGYESITGYKYESWHFRYIGKENALEMKNSGMILENYLRQKN
jgi:D-alanyl-D-alanine carboxypeptidase